jgi:hypothetical protein
MTGDRRPCPGIKYLIHSETSLDTQLTQGLVIVWRGQGDCIFGGASNR